jgi:carboxymethylenebutenolidase
MGSFITLTAEDGHGFDAYRAEPSGTPKAGLLVIQEVFGVNAHMRDVTDGFAADGYLAIAPALYDRAEKNVELGYGMDERPAAREYRAKVGNDGPVMDMKATVAELRSAGKVGSVGYCWGGALAWLTATRLDVDCTVTYYGGAIHEFRNETANCPVMMHFGETDESIPMSNVEEIQAAQPQATCFIYPAGHGFNCDHRADYHAESAALARQRTQAFFAGHLA